MNLKKFFFEGNTIAVDDFYHGTRAAISGGCTTIIDFVIPKKNQSLVEAYDDWRSRAGKKAVCDYGFVSYQIILKKLID